MRKLFAILIALTATLASLPASAGCMALLGVGRPCGAAGGGGGGAGGPLAYTFKSSTRQDATPAPGTATSSISIGASSSDRVVAIAIEGIGSASTNMDYTAVQMDNGQGGGFVPMTLAFYSRNGGNNTGVFYLADSSAATTATFKVLGYVNGWIDHLIYNVGIITGSATASYVSASGVSADQYSASSTITLSVPANGVGIISSAVAEAGATTGAPSTLSGGNATQDNTLGSGSAFGFTGGVGHITTTGSTTVTLTPTGNYGGAFGMVSASFQP